MLRYEKPQLVSLSESSLTYGAPCRANGNSATDCSSFGVGASNNCNSGGYAGNQCRPSGNSARNCSTGTSGA